MVHKGLVDNIIASFETPNSTAAYEFESMAFRYTLFFSGICTILVIIGISVIARFITPQE